VPYVRTVKTASGATAVQIVYSSHLGARDIEHIGSAHDDAELELLKAAAWRSWLVGRASLTWAWIPVRLAGRCRSARRGRAACLLDALERAYRVLGLRGATGGDEVSEHLVLARIIEPVSKAGSLPVLEEAGLPGPSYATLRRRFPVYAKEAWRQKISAACAVHAGLGPAGPG
jgi:hypothetical protein